MDELEKKAKERKVWMRGAFSGAFLAALLCGVVYIVCNQRLPFVDGHLVSGKSGKKLTQIENLIDAYYYENVDKEEMEEYLYYSAAASLEDPYSRYYDAEQYAQTTQTHSGVYTGLGIVMEQNLETNQVTVSQCYENSSAKEAGVLPGDIIYKVNDKIAAEMTLTQLGEYILEEELVVLSIQREGVEGLLEVNVAVCEVEVPSVYSRMLEHAMGYIQISQFTDVTPDQFDAAYQKLLKEGMQGLIIDLRENPGGLLSSVCDTARKILPEGVIVSTETKKGEKEEYTCKGETPIEIPLVLLVNENSASAAEVFAGAVKDYGIGTLVGAVTFGKGIVQRYFTFSDGSALKLTVSAYYTPNGTNIHGIGITPDVEVNWDNEESFGDPSNYNTLDFEIWMDMDNQFEQAVEVLEEAIEKQE